MLTKSGKCTKQAVYVQIFLTMPPSAGHRAHVQPKPRDSQTQQCLSSSEGQPLLYGQAVHQTLQLLLAQLDFILELALLDNERRLHLHKVLVVREAVLLQVARQDLVNHTLSAVQVLLQLLCVLVLSDQQLPLLNQRTLMKKKERV